MVDVSVLASPAVPVVVVVTLPKLLGANVRTWPWLLTIEMLIGADETPPAPLEMLPAVADRLAPAEPRRVAPPTTLLLELTAAVDVDEAEARDLCSHCDRP